MLSKEEENETEDDRENRIALRTRVCQVTGTSCKHNMGLKLNTTFYRKGVAQVPENILFVADVRCRTVKSWKDYFTTLDVSEAGLWDELDRAFDKHKNFSFFIIVWIPTPTPRDLWFQYHPSIKPFVKIEPGGRVPRPGLHGRTDQEMMAKIPMRFLLPVGQFPVIPYPAPVTPPKQGSLFWAGKA